MLEQPVLAESGIIKDAADLARKDIPRRSACHMYREVATDNRRTRAHKLVSLGQSEINDTLSYVQLLYYSPKEIPIYNVLLGAE